MATLTSPSFNSGPAPVRLEPTFRIEGPLTIAMAANWRRRLVAATARGMLVIDAGAVTSCDTIGVQLLVSARRTAEAGGVPFRVAASSPAIDRACAAIGVRLAPGETLP